MKEKKRHFQKIKRVRLFSKSAGFFALCGFFVFSLFSLALAQDENLAITTYYPTPYGVYRTLRLYPSNTVPDTSSQCPNKGELYYYDGTAVGYPDAGLYVCAGSSSLTWQKAMGEAAKGWWASENIRLGIDRCAAPGCQDIYNTNPGNVGIGTMTPNSAKGSSGYVDAERLLLGDAGSWSDQGFWKPSSSDPNNIHPGSARVYIGGDKYKGPQAQFAIKGLGNTASTSSLHIKGFIGSSLLLVRDDGNVGIGTGNPTAKLEVAGQVKMLDGNQQAGRVLTSDSVGIARWQSPLPASDPDKAPGGLYGWCRFSSGSAGNNPNRCNPVSNPVRSPAGCYHDTFNPPPPGSSCQPSAGGYRCCCPDGYTIKRIGSQGGGPDYYSCYKD